MAATDQTYRNQRALDIVFGLSCLLMLLSLVWMFAQDYLREYKVEARDFRDVEEALYERQMLNLVPDKDKLGEIEAAETDLKQARDERDKEAANLQGELNAALASKAKAEATAQGIKADYDSKVSLYNLAVEKRNAAAGTPYFSTVETQAYQQLKQVNELKGRLAAAQVDVDDATRKLEEVRHKVKAAEDRVSTAEDKVKALTADFDRFAKLAVQKRWKMGDAFRRLPVIDGFASPTRIQQYTLNDLTIDYSFKNVPRYDRCTTCHLGIDRAAFSKPRLAELTADPGKDLQAKLANARVMLEKRREILKKQKNDLDPSDLVLTTLSKSELTDARITEYCAHPRLDLFVDGNSPHGEEKFGCTICHGGQGSATDFRLASHTPNNTEEKEHWEKEWGWEANHFWDYPMQSRRFTESSCLKCHYQVTDLLPDGNKNEIRAGKPVEPPGTKVLRGYNLVRENGCFGCHEISGFKGGRPVGPDLRLEPFPALDDLSPAERNKATADPMNPLGTMRKVGPSLRRIAEKTNEDWARKWIDQPRGFRPNTKMPHFYHLGNNNEEALQQTSPEGAPEAGFPQAEIHSIAYYVFRKSEDYLKEIGHYDELKKKPGLNEAETKERDELAARLQGLSTQVLTDPALLPGYKEDKVRGRKLFSEKGCLACHSHQGTNEPGLGVPAAPSEATFAPNLSRIAAKLGTQEGSIQTRRASARKWLVQWIKDPKVHHPRTFMPVTHLDDDAASDIAAWLLDDAQETDWTAPSIPDPGLDTLEKLARVYLGKTMSPRELDQFFANGPPADQLQTVLDEDDREIGSKLDSAGKLKLYVGKKSISQLGCFGCHDIPGFETAKPIGTPLNDWGKKDPERLAFEDVIAYVNKQHPQRVNRITDTKDLEGQPVHALEPGWFEKGEDPYVGYFYDSLAHHQREGFLHQKLREPRSYDYDRIRAWDDRLRMPQFKFARGEVKPLPDESQEQAELRDEAEAREAVMTFILGLVAEPIPLKYVNNPPPERLAVAMGQKVLDKFNCAGCHQLRGGIYEFKTSKPLYEALESSYQNIIASPAYQSDHRFANHNAWQGVASAHPDRLTAHGLPIAGEESSVTVRLTQAVRFTTKGDNQEGQPARSETYDIPAAENIGLPKEDLLFQADPYGGTFTALMIDYLVPPDPQGNRDSNAAIKARSGLPPPLLREGEKAQPAWLFQFLRNPQPIRPQRAKNAKGEDTGTMYLRMPRFSMSDEEATTLVNYFAALEKLENPGVGPNYPYFTIPQRDDGFLHQESEQYLARLTPEQLQQRADKLKPFWDKEAKEAMSNNKETPEALQNEWRQDKIYATDAYHMLTDRKLCLNCHRVGNVEGDPPIGPPLNLAWDRLRPDWSQRWIASPQRLLVYPEGPHVMAQAFLANDVQYGDLFVGLRLNEPLLAAKARLDAARKQMDSDKDAETKENDPAKKKPLTEKRQKDEKERDDAQKVFDDLKKQFAPEVAQYSLNQATALRDILMIYPQVANMPENRDYRPGEGESK